MAFFSRLTDIVTCSLTRLLQDADDPRQALEQIISEMESGRAGAQRSMLTAKANETRIATELAGHRTQVEYWSAKAREFLKAGDENQARLSLVRRKEAENLVAGVQQQFEAATQTCEHLTTTLRALEARLAEARRRLAAPNVLIAPEDLSEDPPGEAASSDSEIDDELEALKRELLG